MVGGRRAAAESQLGEADLGGGPLPIGIDRRPDRIEVAQPVEEAALLRADARERLVEMVMGVDQPGERDQSAPIDDIGLLVNRRSSLADPGDDATIDQDRAVLDLSAGIVHGGHDTAAVDQDHGLALIREAARLTASRIFW